MTHTAVLPMELPFASLGEALAAAGFALVEQTCLGGGEGPDRARWSGQGGELRFYRDIATGLTTIVASGQAAIPPAVPRMGRKEMLALIESPAPVGRLAALQAVETAGNSSLYVQLLPLLIDSDATVAGEAQRLFGEVAGRLLPALAPDIAVEPLAALFAVPGLRHEKLQILRALHVKPSQAERAEPVLGRALADCDWEIAVTAMIAAGRLGIRGLTPSIARLRLPEGKRLGLVHDEARLILALRDACLVRLGASSASRLPQGVPQAVMGDTTGLPLALQPFASALVMPLPRDVVLPPELPEVRWTPHGPELQDGRLLVYVPMLPHWLGDEMLRPMPQPVRRLAPPQGFYIEAAPRPAAAYDAALADIAGEPQRSGLRAMLPTPDLWEMAARGLDGRRYPWGMNALPEARVDVSPWGLSGIATGPGEWLNAPADSDYFLVSGGSRLPIPAARYRCKRDIEHTYRCAFVLASLP
ncbi:hypothetical protein V1283_003340 [Bradyrhizobium sp. AZCC 2262]|uniref:hypothetical protein n=1 Tax=Bradyrhizobium sp. AZCC 2262 TaxID=3117022 RepID=UPI002FF15146